MSFERETRPVIYDKATFRISIGELIFRSAGKDFPRQDSIQQLAENLSRLPKITLSELIELLAQGRGITLDPDTLSRITRKIENEIENPRIVES